MSNALQDLVSGALYNEARMSVLANNIANTGTQGFKEDRVSFELPTGEDVVGSTSMTQSNLVNPQEYYIGKPVQIYTNFSSGQMAHTGNPLDVAIEGRGFFKVSTPDGIQYTRAGNFSLDVDGVLVTPEGFPVLGDGGEITVDGTESGRIEIGADGSIHEGETSVGRLEIVDFPETTRLVKAGGNMFTLEDADAEEQEAEGATVAQGVVEQSNVDVVKSMTDMIDVLRGYESYQKMIQYLEEADGKLISEVGRVF